MLTPTPKKTQKKAGVDGVLNRPGHSRAGGPGKIYVDESKNFTMPVNNIHIAHDDEYLDDL